MTTSHDPIGTRTALVMGEALVDVVEPASGAPSSHPGGSPANVALGLARLGRDVELWTWLGRDDDGALVRQHLEASGVRLTPGSRDADRTSVARARLDASGAATYAFDLAWDLHRAEEAEQTEGADADDSRAGGPGAAPLVVHTGSIATVLEPGATRVAAELAAHRATSTLTYDPNLRPQIMGSAERARPYVERLVALADVVKVSDEDLAWLEPGTDPLVVAARWAAAGPALVVVTRGGDGAFARTSSGDTFDLPGRRVEVVDTVGAGDSFMSGLVDGLWTAGLLGADRRAALHAADHATLERVLQRCIEIGAITVSRAGANPPWTAELTPPAA